jgi:hypothetical protein
MNQRDYFIESADQVDRGDSSRLWTAGFPSVSRNYASGTWKPRATQSLLAQQG